MVRIKWLTDYAGYKKGDVNQVNDVTKLKKHIEAGRIEVLKAAPEKAVAPTPETAVIAAPEVHTRTTKTAKKKK